MHYVVGLTGGIGSGKSEVARAFGELGVDIADADQAAHAVTAKGEAGHRAVVDLFGTNALAIDGTLDRGWIRRHVFEDAVAREQLERALHPLILAFIDRAIASWRSVYGMLVVPLLLERGGLRQRVARVLVVDCPEDLQIKRVTARSAMPETEVRAIMATQLPRAARLARADDIIDNGGPLPALAKQVARLDRFYRERAARAAADA
ncbi:MAG: dephospho-CoA kinase [Betaproteobacteria bacterium]|nr:dephospho-CoA kinase [Betaproteobacteria bacterium]MBA3775795.1 dephospho-CoA kinase [Betaproteobacteria bacterium]